MPNKLSLSEVFDQATTTPAAQQDVFKPMLAAKGRALALDELAQSLEPPKPVDPTTGMSTLQLAGAKAGANVVGLGQGVKQLLLSTPSLLEAVNPKFKERRLNEKAQLEKEIADKETLDAPLKANTDVPSNLLSAVVSPETALAVATGGASILPRIAAQAGLGALRPGDAGTRTGNALKAGTGAAIGEGAAKLVGKGVNAVRGNWQDPAKQQLAAAADAAGVRLSAGDLGSGTARTVEDLLSKVPFTGRQGALQNQGTQLSTMLQAQAAKLAPNGIKTGAYQEGHEGHLLADNILDQYATKKAANNVAWKALDIYLNAMPAIPKVKPSNLALQLGPFMNKYGRQITGMTNEDAARKLAAMAADPKAAAAGGVSFTDLRDMQDALGQLVGQATKQAKTGNVSGDLSGAVQQLYKSAQQDVENWGQSVSNKNAFNLFRAANTDFKTNVLPYRQTPVIKDLVQNSIPDTTNGGWLEYGVDPSMLMKSIIKPGQGQLVKRVYDLADPEGQQAIKYSLFRMKSDPTFNADTGDVRPMAFQAKNKMLKPAGEAIYTPQEQNAVAQTTDILGAADRARINIDDPRTNGLGTYMLGGMGVANPLGVLGALGAANAGTKALGSAPVRNYIMAASQPFTGQGPWTAPLSRIANSLPGALGAQELPRGTGNLLLEED